jgi:hypothetical protein
MAARVGDDLQPVEAPAIGEGERFIEDDRLPGARAWPVAPYATGGSVGAPIGLPAPRVSTTFGGNDGRYGTTATVRKDFARIGGGRKILMDRSRQLYVACTTRPKGYI